MALLHVGEFPCWENALPVLSPVMFARQRQISGLDLLLKTPVHHVLTDMHHLNMLPAFLEPEKGR